MKIFCPHRILISGFPVFIKGYWDTSSFVSNYLTVALFPIIWIGFKLFTKSKMISPKDMDFFTGVKEIIAAEIPEEPPKNWLEKIGRWIA